MKICAIIPSHNHYKMIAPLVQRLREAELPIFIIDDGSDEPAATALAAFHNGETIIVSRSSQNYGKGAAVMEGFRMALAAHYTHALQIDADGQHDLSALPRFLEEMRKYPKALISGQPIYDASIPWGRKIGRWITHIWVWIETLSFSITDSMCGFRIYPLADVQKLMKEEPIGQHMEFDTEIMVRLFWRGVKPIMLPVHVVYPADNISNFHLGADNWRITQMHTQLFLTMLLRLPKLVSSPSSETKDATHWADLTERGSYWGIRFCAAVYILLGRKGCQIILAPIVLYFYGIGTKQRHASQQFLTNVLKRRPSFLESYRHYMNFATRALDALIAWMGRMPRGTVKPVDAALLQKISDDPKGALIIVAHLGNVDVARAMLDEKTRERLTVLVHTRHAESYNRVVQKFRPEAGVRMVQVTEIGPATIIDLKQRVEAGEWIVIAGDRTSVLAREHSLYVPFFGKLAAFPQGPWVLGSLLECPVYLLFCLKATDHYQLTMEPFADNIKLPRAAREETMRGYAARYATRLQHFATLAPFQWYNFFNFWSR